MAISDAYATRAQYRNVMGDNTVDTADPAQDTLLDEQLTAASRYMEGRLRRFFTLDASAVDRVFIVQKAGERVGESYANVDADDKRMLHLPVDIGNATVALTRDTDDDGSFADETAVPTTNWELWPLNAAAGPEAWPWTSIRILNSSTISIWDPGERIQVNAQFGWPAVPEAVQFACIKLVSLIRVEGALATNTLQMGFEQVEETSPEAKVLLQNLIREYGRELPL